MNKKLECSLEDRFHCDGEIYYEVKCKDCLYNQIGNPTKTIDELILLELRLLRQELKSLHQRPVETPDKEGKTMAELFGEGFGNAYNEAMMSTNKENL